MFSKKYGKMIDSQIKTLQQWRTLLKNGKQIGSSTKGVKFKSHLENEYFQTQQKVVLTCVKFTELLKKYQAFLDPQIKTKVRKLITLNDELISLTGSKFNLARAVAFKTLLLGSLEPKLIAKQVEANKKYLKKFKENLSKLASDAQDIVEKLKEKQKEMSESFELLDEANIKDFLKIITIPLVKLGKLFYKSLKWLLEGWIELINTIRAPVEALQNKINQLKRKYNELIGKAVTKLLSVVAPDLLELVKTFTGFDAELELQIQLGSFITKSISALLSFFGLGPFWTAVYFGYQNASSMLDKMARISKLADQAKAVTALADFAEGISDIVKGL